MTSYDADSHLYTGIGPWCTVLSVVAQQILTITRAKAARVKVFEFEGTKLPLRRTCNVFITMARLSTG